MKLKISRTKNSCNLYVQKAFRDRNGKSTSKIVERLGSLEEVQLRAGDKDPMEWAQEYVAELTRADREERRVVAPRFHPDKLIEKGQVQSCQCGYLFLQQIYFGCFGLNRICVAMEKGRKFEFDLNKVMELLVYGRVIAPGSKSATHKTRNLFMEKLDVGLNHVFRGLDVIAENMEYIMVQMFKNSLKTLKRDTTILYYDCTNYFFEIEKADPVIVSEGTEEKPDGGNDEAIEEKHYGLRQYGVAKDHKPNPIVQMGMFIDNTGFPIAMNVNPGNTNEQKTLVPTEKLIVEKMGVEQIVMCTDGGLSSEDNRAFNSTAKRSFITVQSLKKLRAEVRNWALESKGWKILPSTTRQPNPGQTGEDENALEFDLTDEATAHTHGDKIFYRQRWIKNEATNFQQRIIVTFSYKYRDYLRLLRQREIQIAENDVKKGTSGKRQHKSPSRFISERYATKEGEEAIYRTSALNLKAIEDEEKYDGFYAICTDLNDNAEHIININHNRWESEDAFRVLKTELRARPVYVWTDDRIKAHFFTCFIALSLLRVLESKLEHKYTAHHLIYTLREMTMNIIHGEGYRPNYTRSDLTDDLHAMAGFRTDTELLTLLKAKQIMKKVKGR